MLVFSAAGVDSLLKQLVPQMLTMLASHDAKVQKALAKFASRKIRGREAKTDEEEDETELTINTGFLGQVLAATSPQAAVVAAMSDAITARSLQSLGEISRAMTVMGLDPCLIAKGKAEINAAIEARNKIVHEMDVDFDHPTRNRRTRKREVMVEYANALLEMGEAILLDAARKL